MNDHVNPAMRPTRRPPRPWLAALLSLVQSGLGQVYAGEPRTGVAVWIGARIIGIAAIWAASRVPGKLPIMALLVVMIAIPAGVTVHAWSVARRADGVSRAGVRASPVMPTLAFFVVATVAGIVASAWVKRHIAEAYRIPSGAMEPTIVVGDWLFVVPPSDTLRPDALVVYIQSGTVLLKRVVALPSDTIEMREGRLFRDGHVVVEPYAQNDWRPDYADSGFAWQGPFLADQSTGVPYHPTRDTWGPLLVPPGSIFVLGDNRHNSNDSRFTGFVSAGSIVGRPTEIYFSWSSDSSAVRWDRIGRPVELAAPLDGWRSACIVDCVESLAAR